MADSAQWWSWKSIRALAGTGAKDLPASLYQDAIQILNQQERDAVAFKSRIIEAEELFMRGRLKHVPADFAALLAQDRQKKLMTLIA